VTSLRGAHAVLVRWDGEGYRNCDGDLVTKGAQYAAAGLDRYWLVDIDHPQILVLRRDGTTYATHATATGYQLLTVDEPFPVQVRPDDLG
jgi:Uma2 family endonuclease